MIRSIVRAVFGALGPVHRAARISNAFIGLAFDERRHERLIARIVLIGDVRPLRRRPAKWPLCGPPERA